MNAARASQLAIEYGLVADHMNWRHTNLPERLLPSRYAGEAVFHISGDLAHKTEQSLNDARDLLREHANLSGVKFAEQSRAAVILATEAAAKLRVYDSIVQDTQSKESYYLRSNDERDELSKIFLKVIAALQNASDDFELAQKTN